ncbi:MAG: histidine kinase N-terminal 7TM domain-containing protein [Spirochaetia bacterium]|jgi:PAS domain-containing protein
MITPYSLLLFAASFTVLFAGGSAWRRRDVPGGFALSLTLFAIAVWCFFSAIETTSPDAWHRYLWNAISYIGLCNVAPLFLVFAIQYSDSRWPLSPWMIAFLWSVPVATIALAFTNSWHHLIWTGFVPGPIPGTNTVVYSYGAWYFLAVFWFLVTCLLGMYHILRVAIRAARLYVLQAFILIASVLIPWIGFLLFVLPSDPVPGLDTMSLGFAVSALLILAAFNRLRLLDIVPRARAALVENMRDGFLVVDLLNRIIDFNSTAARMFQIAPPAIGKAMSDVIPTLGGALLPTQTLGAPHDPGRTLEVSATPLTSRTGRQTGTILLVRDITERRKAEKEREKLIVDLQDALANVKRLSGLLPICASCKKIRDDKGYWHQVESYMEDHSDVEFSHGLCPDCMQKLYPDLSR